MADLFMGLIFIVGIVISFLMLCGLIYFMIGWVYDHIQARQSKKDAELWHLKERIKRHRLR